MKGYGPCLGPDPRKSRVWLLSDLAFHRLMYRHAVACMRKLRATPYFWHFARQAQSQRALIGKTRNQLKEIA